MILNVMHDDNGQTVEGRVYAYYGSASGLSTAPNWTADENQLNNVFGYVSAAGDVNADGYADVVVGVTGYSGGGATNPVRVYVYHGSASGLSAAPNWMVEGSQTAAWYGEAVSGAGDVNGDGYADVIVGMFTTDARQHNDEGLACIYRGSAAGLSVTPNWVAESNQDYVDFSSVRSAGDVNGDDYTDVILGAPNDSHFLPNAGRVFVYYASASFWNIHTLYLPLLAK